MTSPGKGRYTDYVGPALPGLSSKYSRLHKLFNNNPMTSDKGDTRGLFYSSTTKSNQTSNVDAAKSVVENYVDLMLGDVPNAVATEDGNSLIYFNGNNVDLLPNTKEIDVNKGIRGAPANPYMPDLSSPGALSNNKVNLDKDNDDVNEILPSDYKPDLIISSDTIADKFVLGSVSPHVSSPIVGTVSVGSNLTMGSSIKK